jgi:hypothetical protein
MKISVTSCVAAAALVLFSCTSQNNENFRDSIRISARGNSWITDDFSGNENIISDSGVVRWEDPATVIETFFKTEKAGQVRIALRASNHGAKSKIGFSMGKRVGVVKLRSAGFDTIDLGTFMIEKPGYTSLQLKGLEKTGQTFAEITDILISEEDTLGKIWFVKDDFYWGRRGPSVHFRYDIPQDAGDIAWFYNEITVPEGNDIQGSYFMANGFTDGYFGIQVNSPEERRILFSVWSPYRTDNPKEIPDDYRIKLLKKGDDVHAGEFGNEGSGGQSYLKYMWKAGTTYRFLLRGEPSPGNSTDYSAWFFAPEKGSWQLIASFRRSKASRYLGNLYSFLENFMPETGAITRKGLFTGQWVCDTKGKWTELTTAKFTADATARKESRMDYSGGSADSAFFLRNCGFFDETTKMNSVFTRTPSGKVPVTEVELQEIKAQISVSH